MALRPPGSVAVTVIVALPGASMALRPPGSVAVTVIVALPGSGWRLRPPGSVAVTAAPPRRLGHRDVASRDTRRGHARSVRGGLVAQGVPIGIGEGSGNVDGRLRSLFHALVRDCGRRCRCPVGGGDGDLEGLDGAEASGVGGGHRDRRAPRRLAGHRDVASRDTRRGHARSVRGGLVAQGVPIGIGEGSGNVDGRLRSLFHALVRDCGRRCRCPVGGGGRGRGRLRSTITARDDELQEEHCNKQG